MIRKSSGTMQTRSSSSFSSLANGSFLVKSTTCGRHLTDFAETLHKAWGMKKNIPEPENERSETFEAGDMAPESF